MRQIFSPFTFTHTYNYIFFFILNLFILSGTLNASELTPEMINAYAKQRARLVPKDAKPEYIQGRCRAISENGTLTATQIQNLKQKEFEILIVNSNFVTPEFGDIKFKRARTWTEFFQQKPAALEAWLHTPEKDPSSQASHFKTTISEDLKQIGGCQGVLRFQKNFSLLRRASLYSQGLAHDQTSGSRGEMIIGYDHIQLIRRGEHFDLEKSLKEYRNLVSELEEDKDWQHWDEVRLRIEDYFHVFAHFRDSAKKIGLGNDCQNNALMSSYFLNRCGNCQSNSLLILSLVHDLKIPTPEGFVYGLEVYRDHVAPVIYNKTTNKIIDLYTFKESTSGLTSVVNFDHVMNSVQGYVTPILLQDEKPNTYPEAKILKAPSNNPDQILLLSIFRDMEHLKIELDDMEKIPHILNQFNIPISHHCYVEGCRPVSSYSQHDLATNLKAASKEDEKLEKIEGSMFSAQDTCPFYEPLKKLPYPTNNGLSSHRLMQNAKMMMMLDVFDNIFVESFDLDYEPFICDSSASRTHIKFVTRDQVKKVSKENNQNPVTAQSKTNNMTKAFGKLKSNLDNKLAGIGLLGQTPSKTLMPIDMSIQDKRVPVLVLTSDDCKKNENELKKNKSNANSMCLFTKNLQQNKFKDEWVDDLYPKLKSILETKDLFIDFKSKKQSWLLVREALNKSHLTLFNKVEADHLVIANLEREGVRFKDLFKLAHTLRQNLSKNQLQLTLQIAGLNNQDLDLFLSTIFEISWHFNFISYNFASVLNSAFLEQNFTDPPKKEDLFVGGLFENYLDWYLTNSKYKLLADSLTITRPTTASLASKYKTAISEELFNVSLPKTTNVDPEICKNSKWGHAEDGIMVVRCPETEPENTLDAELKSDPREVIPVPPQLLPYLMAESQRAMISARHQLFALYLWNEHNEKALGQNDNISVKEILKGVFGSNDLAFNRDHALTRIYELNSSYLISQLLLDPFSKEVEDCYKTHDANELYRCEYIGLEMDNDDSLKKYKINFSSSFSKWASTDSLTAYAFSEVDKAYGEYFNKVSHQNIVENKEFNEALSGWRLQSYVAINIEIYQEALFDRDNFEYWLMSIDEVLVQDLKGSSVLDYDFLAKAPDRGKLNKPTYFFGIRQSIEKASEAQVDYYQYTLDFEQLRKLSGKSNVGIIHAIR